MNKNIIITILVIIVMGLVVFVLVQNQSLNNRQAAIHNMGNMVMPFDLDKTTHVFKQTEDGGVQQVRAKDPNDSEQIKLIQEHLKMEASRFTEGDFGDPQTLHGEDMAGLDVLTTRADDLQVEYSDLDDGAQIIYKSDDEEVLNAVHMWFMAQLMDHGEDATSEMMH